MLHLILGTAGTGKTTALVQKIKQTVQSGEKAILIVPEQFSSTAEINTYTQLGDNLSSRCFVYSFRNFCEKIEAQFGGVACKTVTDAGRIVLVRRAVDKQCDSLEYYKKNAASLHFCELCAQMIKEMKIAGAKASDLMQLETETEREKQKFSELGLIYAEYDKILDGTGLEATDRILLASQKISQEYFADTHFFIDNFDGFTSPEYAMLEKIITLGKSCTVSLCTKTLFDTQDGIGLFSGVQKTAARLKRIADSNNITTQQILLAENKRTTAFQILAVDKILQGEEYGEASQQADSVFVTECKDVYKEMQLVAAKIRKLAVSGVAYSKIAVLCRDIERYTDSAEKYFNLYDIPFFCDKATTAEFTAPAVLVRCAMDILCEGINTKNILSLLKTHLTIYDTKIISELENYAYVWQLKSADWKKPFENNPTGFAEKITPSKQKLLGSIEAVRAELVPQLVAFQQRAKGASAQKMLKEIYMLLSVLKSDEVLLKTSAKLTQLSDTQLANEQVEMWDKTITLLDELSDMLCDDEVTAKQLRELYIMLLRSAEVGRLPRTQNQVLLGTADRTRLDDVDYVFVIGLNEGVFPSQVGYSGLLSHTDRELLVKSGIEMPGDFKNRVMLENMFFYRALTCASKGLYLSYPVFSGGTKQTATAVLNDLTEKLYIKPMEVSLAFFTLTQKAAADILADSFHNGDAAAPTLYSALKDTENYAPLLARMLDTATEKQFEVQNTETMKQLMGNDISLSPSRVEKFYTCRFSYFLKYVLKIEPRQKAQINAMQAGTFVHYILENAIKNSGENFTQLTKQQLNQLVQQLAEKFVHEQLKGVEITQRLTQLIARLNKNCTQLLGFIQQEQLQSEFKPTDFELKIHQEGDIAPLALKTPQGQTVKVVGNVDRVDVYKNAKGESYIRVIDYKTGEKSFKLKDVYNGLNMQMLLYLFAITKNGGLRYTNPKAAGVLYLLSDPSPTLKERQTIQQNMVYKVDGLVIEDTEIADKMDKEGSGVFLPVPHSDDKFPDRSYSNHVASLEKLSKIQARVEKLVADMADELSNGKIQAVPIAKENPCEYCDYITVCRHENDQNETQMIEIDKEFNECDTTEQEVSE